MRNLAVYVKKCEEELSAINIPYHKASFSVNTRAKCRWGHCQYDILNNKYLIEINAILLDEANPESALKNTIIHELLHTCDNCMNHGDSWKFWANCVNRYYGYNIKRCSSAEEKGVTQNNNNNSTGIEYKLRCTRCNSLIVKYRMCKVVRNPGAFCCAKCRGNLIPINF